MQHALKDLDLKWQTSIPGIDLRVTKVLQDSKNKNNKKNSVIVDNEEVVQEVEVKGQKKKKKGKKGRKKSTFDEDEVQELALPQSTIDVEKSEETEEIEEKQDIKDPWDTEEDDSDKEEKEVIVPKIYVENYLKMKSCKGGRGSAMAVLDVAWHLKNGYTGGVKKQKKRNTMVRIESSSSLGGLYNSLGTRMEEYSCSNHLRSRVIIQRPIALSFCDSRLRDGGPSASFYKKYEKETKIVNFGRYDDQGTGHVGLIDLVLGSDERDGAMGHVSTNLSRDNDPIGGAMNQTTSERSTTTAGTATTAAGVVYTGITDYVEDGLGSLGLTDDIPQVPGVKGTEGNPVSDLGTEPTGVLTLRTLPRRMDLNRGVRVSSNAVKIDGVFCVYTVYIDNPLLGEHPLQFHEVIPVKKMKKIIKRGSFDVLLPVIVETSEKEREIENTGNDRTEDENVEEEEEVGEEGDDRDDEDEDAQSINSRGSQSSKGSGSGSDNGSGSGSESGDSDESNFATRLFGSHEISEVSAENESGSYDNEEEENVQDSLSKMFKSIPPNVTVTFDFYFPFRDLVGEIPILESSLQSMRFRVEDLYRTARDAQNVLHLALRAAYTGFYDSACEDEMMAVKDSWTAVVVEIISKLIWDISPSKKSISSSGGSSSNSNGDSGSGSGSGIDRTLLQTLEESTMKSEKEPDDPVSYETPIIAEGVNVEEQTGEVQESVNKSYQPTPLATTLTTDLIEESIRLFNLRKMHELTRLKSVLTPAVSDTDCPLVSNNQQSRPNTSNINSYINTDTLSQPVLSISTILFSCAMKVKVKVAPRPKFTATMSILGLEYDDAEDGLEVEGVEGGGVEGEGVEGEGVADIVGGAVEDGVEGNGEGNGVEGGEGGDGEQGGAEGGEGEVQTTAVNADDAIQTVENEKELEGEKEIVNDEDENDGIDMPEFEINIEEYVLESPLMHLSLWQKGNLSGVIAINPENNDICFLEDKNLKTQDAFIESIRFLPILERSHFIKLFFQSIRYSRIMNTKSRIFHGSLSFVNLDDEPEEKEKEVPEFDLEAVLEIQQQSSLSSFGKESISRKLIYHK